MLINRLTKKFPDQGSQLLNQAAEDEVNSFIASEYVTKDSMKQLEQRVSRKLLHPPATTERQNLRD